MCVGGSPNVPKYEAPPPAPRDLPEAVQRARADERRRAAAMQGYRSTVLAAQSLTPAVPGAKTLLGQ